MTTRPFRVILSVFGIMLGVAGLLSISITNQAALDSINNLFETTSGKIDLSVTVSGNQQGFPEQINRKILSISGVKAVIPIIKLQSDLASNEQTENLELNFFGTNAGGLVLHGIDTEAEVLARKYSISEGRFLSDDYNAYEIVLVNSYAEDNDLRVGDRISLLTPNGVEKVKLVGVMEREGPGIANNGNFGVLPLKTAQQMFNRLNELDQVDVIANNSSRDSIGSLQSDIQARLGDSYSVIYPASQGERQTQMLANYQIGLNMMSGIALFVGAFLIYNTFAMTLVERTREFGMLRTIGMSRSQITTQMLIEALILGFTGTLIGIGLGILLSRGLGQMMSSILGVDITKISLSQETVVFSFFLGLLVTLIAAAIPAWQAGRISPISALRIRGNSGDGWLMHSGWKIGVIMLVIAGALLLWNPFGSDPHFTLGSMTVFMLFSGATLTIPSTMKMWEKVTRPAMQLLYGASGVLGSRNIQRSYIRTTLTVAALMVGVSMIIVVKSMTGSFAVDLTNWISAYLGGDIYIGSSILLRADVARRIEAVEGVSAVAPIRYLPVEIQLKDNSYSSINLMAVDPATYSRVTNFAFNDNQVDPQLAVGTLAEGGSIFLSSVLSEKYGYTTGNTVYLKTRQGVKPFKVAAIVIDFYNQGLVINTSWSDLRRYFRVNDANTFFVKVDDDANSMDVIERIDNLYGSRYRLIMESNGSLRNRIFTLIDQVF